MTDEFIVTENEIITEVHNGIRVQTVYAPQRQYQAIYGTDAVRVDIMGDSGSGYRTVTIPNTELRPQWDRPVTADKAGCWLDGAMGWHNAYRVVDRAEEYGFVVPPEYTDELRRFRNSDHDELTDDEWLTVQEAISGQGELSDMATDYLQERAPAGYVFVWDMGELSLLEEWQACEDGCTEDVRCDQHTEEDA